MTHKFSRHLRGLSPWVGLGHGHSLPSRLATCCPKGNSSHSSACQETGGPGKSPQAVLSASASHPASLEQQSELLPKPP